MSYVDGFVLPVPKKNLAAYKKMANWGRKTWMKYGALQYVECVGQDLELPKGCGLPFPKGIRAKSDEAIVFAFVIYKSKAHRDAVMKKVMSDPGMTAFAKKMPFDIKRMMCGGFKTIVES